MWVLATNSLSRGITDTGLAVGAATVLGLGAYRVGNGAMSMEALLIILMMAIEVFRPQRDLRALLHDGMLGLAAAKGVFSVLDAQRQLLALETRLAATERAELVAAVNVYRALGGGWQHWQRAFLPRPQALCLTKTRVHCW